MRSSLFLAALLPVASFAASIKRDLASITSAIATVSSGVTTLNTTLNSFSASEPDALLTVLKIQSQAVDLQDALSNAVDVTNDSPNLNDADSGSLAVTLVNLVTATQGLITNLVSHKPDFDKAVLGLGSVSPQVKYDLQQQQGLADQLSAAIVCKLTATFQGAAPIVVGPLDTAFTNAIDTFSTPGGLFALPASETLGEFEALLGQFL